MTVHIAITHPNHAVLFSDSQGSTDRSEIHGWHKQFVGRNFAVGVAGHGGIIAGLFENLASQFDLLNDYPFADVMVAIQKYILSHIQPQVQGSTSILFMGYDGPHPKVWRWEPSVFRCFSSPQSFSAIGSGAEFVGKANARNSLLGIDMPSGSVAEMIVSAIHYAEAANESLTVDDLLSVVLFINGRTYLLGEKEVSVQISHPNVIANWRQISEKWIEFRTRSTAIESEFREATRFLSLIRCGNLEEIRLQDFKRINNAVALSLIDFNRAIDDFCVYYDALVGR
jgi:hypothetical protein